MAHKDILLQSAMNALCGKRLVGVSYYELANESDQPDWARYGERFDSLDFGLDLALDNGSVVGLIWDQSRVTYSPYGVSVEDTLRDLLKSPAIWDVAANSRWASYIGKRIEGVELYWLPDNPGQSVHLLPQDVEIVFENDEKVLISAAKYSERGDSLAFEIDEIVVTFDGDVARRYRMGPHMPSEGNYW